VPFDGLKAAPHGPGTKPAAAKKKVYTIERGIPQAMREPSASRDNPRRYSSFADPLAPGALRDLAGT
jgi:hypothetical protein